MSKKANPTAIGIFVVGATIIVAAAIFLLGTEGMFDAKKELITYFQGDANGLSEGADVRMGGIKIGTVQKVRVVIDKNTGDKLIPVVMELSAEKLSMVHGEEGKQIRGYFDQAEIRKAIDQGFKTRLKKESMLSGRLFVDLDILPDKEGFFYTGKPIPELEGYVQVPSQEGMLKEIFDTLSESFNKISKINLVEVTENLNTLLVNVDVKLAELDLKKISDGLVGTLEGTEELMANNDLKNALANLDAAMVEFKGLGTRLNNDNIDKTLEKIAETMEEAHKAAEGVAVFIHPESPFATRMNKALSELTRTAGSIRSFTDYLRKNPNALVAGKKIPK